MSQIVFRPIDAWPGDLTRQRKHSPFQAPWPKTEQLLVDEVDRISKRYRPEIILQVAAGEEAMRLDGSLRANAQPSHPGVIVSFDSKHGPLRYFTDVFDRWQGNARAIALGLEALRRVERYGIASRGEQYTGWKAIGSGIALGPPTWTVESAFTELLDAAGLPTSLRVGMLDDKAALKVAYRKAAAAHHPDRGGTHAAFTRIQSAFEFLESS